MQLHWDGNNNHVEERNLNAAFGTGATPPSLDHAAMTRIQLWIAVVSVVLAAVLSGAAYFQDKANNAANDKWQEKLLSSINEGNRQRNTFEQENKQWKAQVGELSEQVSGVSAAKVFQPSAAGMNSLLPSLDKTRVVAKTLPPP